MTELVYIDDKEINITPFFQVMQIENIPQSENMGYPVYEMKEMIRLQFAGVNSYSPIVPVDSFWKKEGLNVLTYAERWPEQYNAFRNGDAQTANGSPLQHLIQYGATPADISHCRALKIYSIEALHSLSGDGVKRLGMRANALQEFARKFLAERGNGEAAMDEIAKLRAEIDALKAGVSTEIPTVEKSPEQIEAIGEINNRGIDSLTDSEIREYLFVLTGVKPKGQPSRETLENMLNNAILGE